MVVAVGSSGMGNGWGQIKKLSEPVVAPSTATAPEPVSTPTLEATTTITGEEPSAVPTATDASPLTYSAPSSRPVAATPAEPRTTLTNRLTEAGYYSAPQVAAIADPVVVAAQQDSASLTAAQVIAQAAYGLVARASENNQMDLIQQA